MEPCTFMTTEPDHIIATHLKPNYRGKARNISFTADFLLFFIVLISKSGIQPNVSLGVKKQVNSE